MTSGAPLRPAAGSRRAGVFIGAVEYNYAYDAQNSRVTKTRLQTGGNQVTVYLGPEVEISASGQWTKYLNDDVKRVGNGRILVARRCGLRPDRDVLARRRTTTTATT